MKDIYIVVLWPLARSQEERILTDLRHRMLILADLRLTWPDDPAKCFARFYGCKADLARGKADYVGGGEFRLLIVRDENAVFEWRETSRGHEYVNANIFNLKSLYREWTGGGHAVHTTNSPEETRRDLYLLTGNTLQKFATASKIENPEVLPGTGGWKSLRELFRALGECMRYVVLRNSESLPDKFDPTLHGDIDLLVDDELEAASVLAAQKVFDTPNRVHYEVQVGGQPIRFDFRHVGDRYYDSRWERSILADRILGPDGVFRPDPINAFHSLAYHAIFQKSVIVPDYFGKLTALAEGAGIRATDIDGIFLKLEDFLHEKRYLAERPNDPSVFFDGEIPRWRQIATDIESTLPVTGLMIVNISNRKPQSSLMTFCYKGALESGRPCFVKYMPSSSACLENEWKMTSLMYAADSHHVAEPLFHHVGVDGSAIIVSEMLVGQVLSTALKEQTLLPEQAKDIARQMTTISSVLKKTGLCHRDVRPDNLFLSADGSLKLIDFQFATPLDTAIDGVLSIENGEAILFTLGDEFRCRRGLWNDALSLAKCVAMLPEFQGKAETISSLESDAPGRYYAAKFPKRMVRKFRRNLAHMAFKNFRRRLTNRPPKDLDQIEFLESVCKGKA